MDKNDGLFFYPTEANSVESNNNAPSCYSDYQFVRERAHWKWIRCVRTQSNWASEIHGKKET